MGTGEDTDHTDISEMDKSFNTVHGSENLFLILIDNLNIFLDVYFVYCYNYFGEQFNDVNPQNLQSELQK